MAQDVFGIDRHLAAAAGRVDDVLRHGVAARVTAQLLHDLDPLAHAGAQMRGAGDQVALVDVIRLHAAHEQLLHVRLHHQRIVVDVLEQDALVAERNARIGQPAHRVAHLGRQLARMIRVDAQEQRMKFFQHLAEFRGDALGQKRRDARADAQEFNVRNRAQPGQQVFQLFVAQQQRVAAAEQHVADFRVRGDVGDLLVELRMKVVAGRVAHEPRARAVAAICGAAVSDQK